MQIPWPVIALALVLAASGCTAPQGQGGNQSAANQSWSSPSGGFSELQREITVLYQAGNPIGDDHYARLEGRLDSFQGQVDQQLLDQLRQQLSTLRAGQQPASSGSQCGYPSFAELKRVITVLHTDGNIIGDDRYQDFQTALDCFEAAGEPPAEVATLRQILPQLILQGPAGTQPSSPAAPSLPACSGQRFTTSFIDLTEIQEISPRGAIGPPGHTFPTEHVYIHVSAGRASTRIVPLLAPADIIITGVGSSPDDVDPTRTEYGMTFALCKDVFGYFKHVKDLDPGLKAAWESAPCDFAAVNTSGCGKTLRYAVKAGSPLGGVGHLQGNFDLGAYDLRATAGFANLSRYTSNTPHIICPLDLFDEPFKSQLYGKIKRTQQPRCGEVMQDVPGTLQGNWFFGSANPEQNWSQLLAFVHDNDDPSEGIVSIGGTLSGPGKIIFTPQASGAVNREPAQVTPDGTVYCYSGTGLAGRVLVQLLSPAQLKIEVQQGSCGGYGSPSFQNPLIYSR